MNKKIKIAHAITRLIHGGAQRVCLDIIEHLNPERYDITLIAGNETGSEGDLFREAEAHHLRLISIPALVRKISLVADIRAFFHLWKIFLRERFSIVHLHTSKAGLLGVLAARLAGVPIVIYSSHGHIFDRRMKLRDLNRKNLWFLLFLRRIVCALSDRVIALTPQDEKEQVGLKIASYSKFQVIYNGIDIERFEQAKALNRERIRQTLALAFDAFPVLICVSRLTSEKGLALLLDAFAKIVTQFPKARLLIAGDGPDREMLVAQAQTLGVHSWVSFLGRRTNIPELLRASDIFILPSQYEAMGIVLAEAMAMELPVVATHVGGVPGIVEHGMNGILVEPENPKAILDAVKFLAKDEMLRKKMAANGYQRAKELFSMDAMIEKIEKLYEKLLHKKGILKDV